MENRDSLIQENFLKKELNYDVKQSKKNKIIFGICIGIIIILLIALIIVSVSLYKKSSEKSESKAYNIYYGHYSSYINLSYAVNDKIENSFKIGGENYIEDIGNLNNGENYEKNERNVFDLYIPDIALERKDKINGILLWIHGGAWTFGVKEDFDYLAKIYANHGYITATIGYTILVDQYKVFNIYRIMDEITAAIKAIKKELESKGFDGNKLRLAIGGYSAGSHLTLLYSYLIKNVDIIPLKFIIDFVGPIGLEEKYYFKVKSINETLPSIENITEVEKAKDEGKLVQVDSSFNLLVIINAFYGNKYSYAELYEMLDENGMINKKNEKFKTMYKVIKYSDIEQIEDKHKIPTICIYGGTDDTVGVTDFGYLKRKADKDGRHLDLVYLRYEGHSLMYPEYSEEMKLKIWDVNILIMNYIEKYFNS